jgi:CRISPR-associated protein Cst2
MSTPIVSLSIAARMTLNMHSLNNEGGEGNQIQTRMIDIVDEDNVLYKDRVLRHIVLPYEHVRSSRNYSWYQRIF